MSHLPIKNRRFYEEGCAAPIYLAAFIEILEHISVASTKNEGVLALVIDEDMNARIQRLFVEGIMPHPGLTTILRIE